MDYEWFFYAEWAWRMRQITLDIYANLEHCPPTEGEADAEASPEAAVPRASRRPARQPGRVRAALFEQHRFFDPLDKVQVKYEMLRAHAVEGRSVVAVAEEFGFSRETYYTVLAAFQARGVPGLVDGKPGRPGPLKLTDEAAQWVWQLHRRAPDLSGRAIADRLAEELGVEVHRRTIERLLRGAGKKNG